MSGFKSFYTEEERKQLVEIERARLEGIFKDIGKKKLAAVSALIDNAATASVTLRELSLIMERDGAIEVYSHGSQVTTRSSAASTYYNRLLVSFNRVINSLVSHLPKDEIDEADSKLARLVLGKFMDQEEPEEERKERIAQEEAHQRELQEQLARAKERQQNMKAAKAAERN